MMHDGMRSYRCAREFGTDAANRLNRAAIRRLAGIEVRRVAKAAGIRTEGVKTGGELPEIVHGMSGVARGDFMDFTYRFPQDSVLEWKMSNHFALEGMKMMGVAEQYGCGILYRVPCSFESPGIEYEVESLFEGRMMLSEGGRSGTVKFDL